MNGTPDGRVAERTGFIRSAYEGADRFLSLAQSLLHDPTTFVSSDHGFAPQFAAIDASQRARRSRSAVDAADLELPPGHG